MSWSSNDNNSPWGKKPRDNKNNSSNSSGNGYSDDYLKGFQDKLKNMFHDMKRYGVVVYVYHN